MLRTRYHYALATLSALLAPNLAHSGELHLTVEDVRSTDGRLLVQVLASEAQFRDEQPAVAQMVLPPVAGDMDVTVQLSPGSYGIRVMHDENDNGKLDTNMLGIPREPWGFSNNATGSFGPPSWDDVQFEVGAEGATHRMRLNH